MDEIKDEELDKIIEEKESSNNLPEVNQQENFVQPKFEKTIFENKMEDVKINVLKQASEEDKKFVDTIKQNLKQAAITNTEVEQNKADLQNKQVESEKKKTEKEIKQTENAIKEDKWQNREKWRLYIYNGFKPLMTFVNINEPMGIIPMFIFAIILFVPFLIAKLWNATIGALITGASDGNRSKAMKGFIWTILGLALLFGLLCLICLFLKSQGIDALSWLR